MRLSKKQIETLALLGKHYIESTTWIALNKFDIRSIDALARRGLVFDGAITSSGWLFLQGLRGFEYSEIASYLATGKFRIRNNFIVRGKQNFIPLEAVDMKTWEKVEVSKISSHKWDF